MPAPRRHRLNLNCQISDEVACMAMEGELISTTRFDPERVLREWHEAGVQRVIIRCARLEYIDSAGLSTLLGALHRYRRDGGDLILAEMNPRLEALFEITSMEKYFRIFPTIEEATRHFDQMKEKRPKKARKK
jgi:anti-sigma B factor antagonist